MADCCMTFSDDWREFLKEYSFKDEDEVYTNGSQLIQVFRVEQLIEHLIAQELLKRQTVGGWVSVKDRMPKDGQDVLAYLNDGEETRIAPCNYFNGVWFDSVMNCVVVLQDVTHWMPLPEPPKEDDA